MSEMFPGEEVDFDEPADEWSHAAPDSAPELPEEQAQEDDGVQPYELLDLSEVKTRPVDWLWNRRIPRDMITVVEGHPSTGKSSVLMDLVARMTVGREFPVAADAKEESLPREPMRVLWITQEDDPACVLKPRFIAAGGDPAMLRIQPEIEILGGQSLDRQEQQRRWARVQKTLEIWMPQCVVFDPGSVTIEDGNSESITRSVMGKLWKMGQEFGFTTLWIRHLAKNNGERDLEMAGLGSVGVLAQARSVLQIYRDKSADEGGLDRIIQQVKSNLGPIAPTLDFKIVGSQVPDETNEGSTLWTSEVHWSTEASTKDAETLVRVNHDKAKSEAKLHSLISSFEHWAQRKGEFEGQDALSFINMKKGTKTKRLADVREWPQIKEELELIRDGNTFRYSKHE